MTSPRERLDAMAGPGGPLEVRRPAAPWTGAPQFAGLAARLTRIEWDILDYLDSHKAEIAPDDYSAQDVAVESVRRYFGLAGDELSVVVESLAAEGLAETRGACVGLTVTGVELLASRSR